MQIGSEESNDEDDDVEAMKEAQAFLKGSHFEGSGRRIATRSASVSNAEKLRKQKEEEVRNKRLQEIRDQQQCRRRRRHADRLQKEGRDGLQRLLRRLPVLHHLLELRKTSSPT